MRPTVPFFSHAFSEGEIAAVSEVLKRGWPGRGPKVEEFERRFAGYLGLPHAVAVSSGTAAVHLCLEALDVRGGEVVTSPFNFIGLSHAIIHAGASPVFCDIDPATLTMDAADLARVLSPRVKAVIVAHHAGHMADMEAISEVAGAAGVPVIEDAAQACGGRSGMGRAGTLGRLGCFSFDPVKNMTSGEGGMVVTADEGLASRIRSLRWLGISRSSHPAAHQAFRSRPWYYNVEAAGYQYLMSDINAALGLAQLEGLDVRNDRRARIAAEYSRGFAGIADLATPVVRQGVHCVWQRYVIRTPRREQLLDHLAGRGIGATVHYLPAHHYELYRRHAGRPLPVCEEVWPRVLSLPLYPALAAEQVAHVIGAVRGFFESPRCAAGGPELR